MTLLIAFLLIYQFDMHWTLYIVAIVVWVFDLLKARLSGLELFA
jgi:hypothetical protein